MKSLRFPIVLALVLSLCGGCAKKDPPKGDTVLQSYKLIDAGRSDEAIVILENEFGESPKDKNARIALASAYAAYAGLAIYEFYDLLYDAIFKNPLIKANQRKGGIFDLPNKSGGDAKSDKESVSNQIIGAMINNLYNLSNILLVLRKLPTVAPEVEPFLKRAITLLEETENLTKSEHLFRSVLDIIALKMFIFTNAIPTIFERDKEGECQIRFDYMTLYLAEINGRTIKVFEGLKQSLFDTRDKQVTADETIQQLKTTAIQMITTTTHFWIVDAVSEAYIKRRLLGTELAKGLQCDL